MSKYIIPQMRENKITKRDYSTKTNEYDRDPRCGFLLFDKMMECLLIMKEKYVTGGGTKWGFPKGHLEEEDKNLFECAIRETFEEINLDLNKYRYKIEGEVRFNQGTSIAYKVRILNDMKEIKFKEGDEALDIAWIKIEDLREQIRRSPELFNRPLRDVIRKV